MAEPPKMLYCRGCNTESEEHHFDDYKQCNMCREKSFTRKRRKVTCECGRTLLACSLKIHLRSIYHAARMRLPPLVQHPPVMKKLAVLPPPPGIKKQQLSPTQHAAKPVADIPKRNLAANKQTPAKQMPAKPAPVVPPRPAVTATGNGALVFMTNMR